MLKVFIVFVLIGCFSLKSFSQDFKIPISFYCGKLKTLSKEVSNENISLSIQLKKVVRVEYFNEYMVKTIRLKKVPLEVIHFDSLAEEEQIAALGLFNLLKLAKEIGQNVCVSINDHKDDLFRYHIGIGTEVRDALEELTIY